MRTLEMHPPQSLIDAKFAQIWQANDMRDFTHPAVRAGEIAQERLRQGLEESPSVLRLTDVTLRDGQQQRTNEVTIEQRVEVFDRLVETGVDRIEIGHLGNSDSDQPLAGAIVRRVAELEATDERYAGVKLQVLFGSQEKGIREGIAVLCDAFMAEYGAHWEKAMADKVIVHVYDRLDENLTATSSDPYGQMESAQRVRTVARHAVDAGFKHFSLTGEAATAATPEEAIQYYRTLTDYLFLWDAETVNINLANTYGFSSNPEWNPHVFAWFNAAVKHGYLDGSVTSSIHTHNDVSSAVEVSIGAAVAGIDRIEGTLIGMGERPGNVGTVDVVDRVVEAGRHKHEQALRPDERISRLSRRAGRHALRRTVRLDPRLIDNIGNMSASAQAIADTFGPHAQFRWEHMSLGNPYAHDNGSGPHDAVMKKAVEDPEKYPPYRTYEWKLTNNGIMGRPDADALAIGDPEAVRRVTVGNHAGGKSTKALLGQDGQPIKRASPEVVARAKRHYEAYKQKVIGNLATGVVLFAG